MTPPILGLIHQFCEISRIYFCYIYWQTAAFVKSRNACSASAGNLGELREKRDMKVWLSRLERFAREIGTGSGRHTIDKHIYCANNCSMPWVRQLLQGRPY